MPTASLGPVVRIDKQTPSDSGTPSNESHRGYIAGIPSDSGTPSNESHRGYIDGIQVRLTPPARPLCYIQPRGTAKTPTRT